MAVAGSGVECRRSAGQRCDDSRGLGEGGGSHGLGEGGGGHGLQRQGAEAGGMVAAGAVEAGWWRRPNLDDWGILPRVLSRRGDKARRVLDGLSGRRGGAHVSASRRARVRQ